MRARKRGEGGFSLLETLVAFALAALFLGIALPATVSSLDRLADVEHRSTALAAARSTLERHLVIARIDEGTFDGHQNGFTWRASILRAETAPPADHPISAALRRVDVEVSAIDGKPLIRLTAYRLGELR